VVEHIIGTTQTQLIAHFQPIKLKRGEQQ